MAEAGRSIGPYRLLSVLGRGAMGEVWKARDERLDRLVALKLLPRDQKSNARLRARMLREAKAAASVLHPNVVTLYDIISDGGEDVLVMELVSGTTLADEIASGGPLAAADAMAVLLSLTDALAAAHKVGILHRDVKTANIMRTGDGVIKVLDFGLAKLRETLGGSPREPLEAAAPRDLAASPEEIALDQTMTSVDERELSDSQPEELLVTRAGQILGTPLYMAPEQFAGEAPTARSEVFAVGVVGYELLSGAPPFVGSSYADLQEKVFTTEPEALPDPVPRPLAQIIERALAKEPEARFATMAELGAEIGRVNNALRRPRRVLWAIAALTALIGAVALTYFVTRGPAKPAIQAPAKPGDSYVAQALREYNLFYNQKAAASLRAALREAPEHPLAYAYAILFPTEEGAELDRLVAAATRIKRDALSAREQSILDAALVLAERGPQAARDALGVGSNGDGEIAFWIAELSYRARDYEAARAGFAAALQSADASFSGRIYDHYSAVLSFLGDKKEAARIGELYAKAFAGEPDAIGVYATTLAGIGELDHALEAANEALRLYRGEDTVAGLAKIHAIRGELGEARALYRKSAAMAPDSRRPLRNAALAYLSWMAGDDAEARAAVADCMPGGADAEIWERGPCLWVAGTIFAEKTDLAIRELDALAAASSALRPAYGSPAALADLLRARAIDFRGACHRAQPPVTLSPEAAAKRAALLRSARDFYASYHIPLFADYVACELGETPR